MAKVKIQGHASGTGVFTLTSPNSNTDRTITLPDADVTLGTDATKLPLAGGALTGNVTSNSKLTINNATVQGALLGVYTGAFDDAGVVAESGIHLANNTAANTVMQMTFGLQSPSQTKAAGYIGFKNTDVSGLTKGALIFGTRDVVTDTAPTERMRIDSSGRVGIGTLASNYYSSADNLVVYDATDHVGMTIASGGSGKINSIYFADGTSGTAEYEGSIEYHHSTNTMLIGTNHATVLSIDSIGAVTMPKQPAFLAYHNTTTSNIANGNTIAFNTTIFDQNDDLHASNGVFTAPVTGKYQFSFLVSVTDLDASATYNRILLKSSNRTAPFGITHANMFSGDPGYYSFEGSLLLDMDANDTCFLEWNQAGGNSQADVFDSTYFSAYLVC